MAVLVALAQLGGLSIDVVGGMGGAAGLPGSLALGAERWLLGRVGVIGLVFRFVVCLLCVCLIAVGVGVVVVSVSVVGLTAVAAEPVVVFCRRCGHAWVVSVIAGDVSGSVSLQGTRMWL
ncbi:hypothetical protein SAMN02745178_00019 [Gemmiger formicilis]|uniref:Uncharacterized protein n=1 Tax=Gemmiger formicilis TaxID=745368 RepID=A0A1T4W6J3_9FIRM|nr:hypothetical protein SAMN02745178_00019 [Gemmiger formicilis]